MFKSPVVRLAGRALVAALATVVVSLQASSGTDTRAAVQGALVAGALVFCELFTPLNSLVGLFKGGTP